MHRLAAVTSLLLSCFPLRAQTVLVLPFFNHSKSANLDWIGESISEAVHDALSSEGLLVLDREARLEGYRRLSLRPGVELTRASIIKIGQTLDAGRVMFGYYEVFADSDKDAAKGSIHIAARIIDLKRLHQGSEFAELGALADLATLETHLGWQAFRLLRPGSQKSETEFVRARPPVRMDAAESYVRGLLAHSADERHRFFTKAARLDEHYSQPCFQLGKAAWANKDYRVAAGWLGRVDRSDSHYLEAQFLLGLCRYYTGDFANAEQSFQLVGSSVPLNEVYNNLGAAQARRNNLAGAIANFKKALEGDGSDPDYYFNLGYAYWLSGKYAEAAGSFRDTLERNEHDTEAAGLLRRAQMGDGPRPGETRLEARERVKTNYDETAYRELQAELESKN
jgi:tetratricopeptide (TPR) repeat protein